MPSSISRSTSTLPKVLLDLLALPPPPLSPPSPPPPARRLPESELATVSPCARPGFHLLNGDWERAHEMAQAHEGEEGGLWDWWHAIAHRTEGGDEYWNSQYWFGRISHPLLLELYPPGPAPPAATGSTSRAAIAAAQKRAKQRVDEVEAAVGGRSGEKGGGNEGLDKVVWDEVKRLTEWCLAHGEQ